MAGKFPYPYGSDLHWLWGWGQRIGAMLDDHEQRSEFDCMIFRPDRLADDAMMRYSIDYPAVIAELRAKLQSTEDAFADYLKKRGKTSAAILSDWLDLLQGRIVKAAELIAESEGVRPNPASIPKSNIRARERDDLDGLIAQPIAVAGVAVKSGSEHEASHLSSELCAELGGIRTATLNKYAKLAGVVTPRRGQRDHRYSDSDRISIVKIITILSSDATLVQRCRSLLEIETKSKARK